LEDSVVTTLAPPRYRAYGPRDLPDIAARYRLADDLVRTIRLFSLVLPFRVNDYLLSKLIDWDRIPDDPMFQLIFPQPGMLSADDERTLGGLSGDEAKAERLAQAVERIRARLNPHPAGQAELNVPAGLEGVQHKYRETVLYFPAQGQSCHAYCTYCFRWAQFVGDRDLRFAAPSALPLVAYLRQHPEVSDVLLTGGDPMMMSADRLRQHVEPILAVDSVRTIRIGTKSVAYWPHRFGAGANAEDTLRLFERVVASGRTLALMAHFSHARELATDAAQLALRRIRATGAVLYGQAPLIGHVNDDGDAWAELWCAEHAAGVTPYYQFVARDTGPRDYFAVPLARAVDIFQNAYRQLPGLARTVRGPVMSTTAGKIAVDGVQDLPDGRFFALRFLQARDPSLVGRPFRAHYDACASWLDDLDIDEHGTPADIAKALRAAHDAVSGEVR
jgi:L-lysine 2,3-aminomutase